MNADSQPAQPTLQPTAILDYHSRELRQFAGEIGGSADAAIGFLQRAHHAIVERVRPVYTVKELQPVSVTLRAGKGSCSQRLACLEALARHRGIATRVRALWISGQFWHRRFPFTRMFIPRRILLAWPQFFVDGHWISVEELFGPLDALSTGGRFTNDGETLFEALQQTAIDFDGRTRLCTANCDLSGFVEHQGRVYDTRDELFASLGSFEHTVRGVAFELLHGGRKSA